MRAALGSLALSLWLVGCDDGPKESSAPAEGKGVAGPVDAFTSYQAKSKAVEAKINIKAITQGLRMLHEQESFDPATSTVVAGRLPASVPMTPPVGTCCKQPNGTCAPDQGDWDHETWKAIDFRPRDPHRYSYAVEVDGQTVTVRAAGDLDCDGEASSYSTQGRIVDGVLEFPAVLEEQAPLE